MQACIQAPLQQYSEPAAAFIAVSHDNRAHRRKDRLLLLHTWQILKHFLVGLPAFSALHCSCIHVPDRLHLCWRRLSFDSIGSPITASSTAFIHDFIAPFVHGGCCCCVIPKPVLYYYVNISMAITRNKLNCENGQVVFHQPDPAISIQPLGSGHNGTRAPIIYLCLNIGNIHAHINRYEYERSYYIFHFFPFHSTLPR